MSHVVPLLSAQDLSCGYQEVPVCGRFSADVHAGEVLGVVGFNGSGKSTALRSIAGRQEPLKGAVHFRGSPRREGSAGWRRAVAAVFDDDSWFPGLTVEEHLQLVAAGHQLSDPETAVAREIEFFGLSERAGAFPEALSSGQRRRLLLAGAFIRPADLFLLDEPEQRLDPVMITELGTRLLDRVEGGAAAIVVTHDPVFLQRVADRCLVIDDDVRLVSPAEGAVIIGTHSP